MPEELYHELHRPQFHFTPARGWTNDPNGLVCYAGEYHLFFQHNPVSVQWGNMTWGHAVSRDLVRWTQLPDAIEPDELGTIFSGSAVVDRHNTGGFQSGREKALVAIYTSAGSCVQPPRPFAQSIAYSNDHGRTWSKYAHNPVLGHIRAQNRDPKVIWHEPTRKWVMALFLAENDYCLLGSPDLKRWTRLCDVTLPGAGECPDFFELPAGDSLETKWVFWGAAGLYRLGRFDGVTFAPETDSLKAEWGSNGYAAQTWSDIPPADGRRIQISWMRDGRYPAMPFNQQMSFPVELSLRATPQGLRLCRTPVREIALLYGRDHAWRDLALQPGRPLVPPTDCELFDIQAEIDAAGAGVFVAVVRGNELRCSPAEGTVRFLGQDIPGQPVDGRMSLRLLMDRTSLEVFVNEGSVSASICFLPAAADHNLEFLAARGGVTLVSLSARELKSAWTGQQEGTP